MANFDEFQRRLDDDEGLRRRFLRDPVCVLTLEGFVLTKEIADSLRESVDLCIGTVPIDQAAKPKWEISTGVDVKISGEGDEPTSPPPPPPPPPPPSP